METHDIKVLAAEIVWALANATEAHKHGQTQPMRDALQIAMKVANEIKRRAPDRSLGEVLDPVIASENATSALFFWPDDHIPTLH